jgi:2-iminobutanoate/2-iminopropanoate deaminase
MPMIRLLVVTPLLLASVTAGASVSVTHYPAGSMPSPVSGKAPPFSSAVMAGDTLYVAGTTDMDPATGKPPTDVAAGAKLVLDNIKRTVEKAGLTMNDLVWVQVFASDLKDYAAFNDVYRTYFTGPMPARAFLGAGSLLGGAHFEVMGIAARSK